MIAPSTDSLDEFNKRILSYGGRADIAQFYGDAHHRALKIQKRFLDITGYISSAVPAEANAWASSLRIGWVANSSINAIAIAGKRYCHVGLFLGVLEQLWIIYLALASHPLYFKDIPGAIEIEGYEAASRWNATLASLIQYPADPNVQVALKRFSEARSERVKVAESLYTSAVDFLIMHEIHHFWCGHIFAFNEVQEYGMAARPLSNEVRLRPNLRQALESHADMYAVHRTFEAFSFNTELSINDFCHIWLTAVSVLFVILAPYPIDYQQWTPSNYPHPHDRFLSVAAAAERAMRTHFRIMDEDWDKIFSAWLMDVALLEVMGTGVLAPPFGEVLSYGDEVLQNGSDRINTLELSMQTLEESRQKMLDYFNQDYFTGT